MAVVVYNLSVADQGKGCWMSRRRKPSKNGTVEIWVNHSHNPNQEPWSIEKIPNKNLTIVRLMHTNSVQEKESLNNNKTTVCYRGFKIRAWAIRTKANGDRVINLYDNSGKTVHWYELDSRGTLIGHSSQSPNHTNRSRKKRR